jgi:hypothetical protein
VALNAENYKFTPMASAAAQHHYVWTIQGEAKAAVTTAVKVSEAKHVEAK